MASQLLINVLTVTVPAGAFGYPAAHGLKSNGVGVAPTLILPQAQSPVSIDSADETNVYLSNAGDEVVVVLRCERDLSMQADAAALPPFFKCFSSRSIAPSREMVI